MCQEREKRPIRTARGNKRGPERLASDAVSSPRELKMDVKIGPEEGRGVLYKQSPLYEPGTYFDRPTWFPVYASDLSFGFAFRLSSYGSATLGTGGWLDLTRQGLAPCKKRQACLGPRIRCSAVSVRRPAWMLARSKRRLQDEFSCHGQLDRASAQISLRRLFLVRKAQAVPA